MLKRQSRTTLGVLAALLVVSVLGIALSIAVVSSAGIGWDSHFDLTTGLVFLSLPPDATFASVLASIPDQDIANGPFRFQLAQWLGSVTTGSAVLDASAATSYFLVSLVIIAMGTIALITLAIAIRCVTGSWLPGLIAFSLTATLPLWVGIAGIAWRDIPVAAGVTITASGLIIALSSVKRSPVIAGALVALGTFIAVSTRAGSLALILATVFLGGALVAWTRKASKTAITHILVSAAAGVLIGVLLAIASHPVARLDPWGWISTSIRLAGDNPNATLVKVMAQDVLSSQLPLWYIPAYLLAQIPLLTLLLIGLALLVLVSGRVIRVTHFRASPLRATGLVLLIPSVVLPVVLTVAGTNMYDGLRHVLFIFPALFGLVGLIIWRIHESIDRRSLVAVLMTFIVIAPAVSLFASWRWFPYSYAFINPVAGIVKEPRIWELDYWGLSVREGAEQLRSEGVAAVGASPSANSAIPWDVRELADLARENPTDPWGAYVFLRFGEQLPEFCEETFTIERDGHVLGVGGICTPGS